MCCGSKNSEIENFISAYRAPLIELDEHALWFYVWSKQVSETTTWQLNMAAENSYSGARIMLATNFIMLLVWMDSQLDFQ